MAGEAFGIVSGIFADDIFVRIVASHTTYARIRAVKAFAVGQAIGLEANVDLPVKVASDNAFPGAMTLAAKVGEIFRR